jgi:hypothetical protein
MNSSLYHLNWDNVVNTKNDLLNLSWFSDFQHYIEFFKRVGDITFSVDVHQVHENVLLQKSISISDHYTNSSSNENIYVLSFTWENQNPIHVLTLDDALQTCKNLQQKVDEDLVNKSLHWIYDIEHKMKWHVTLDWITPFGVGSIRTMMYDKNWFLLTTKSLLEKKKILYAAQAQIETMIKKINNKPVSLRVSTIIDNSKNSIQETIK